MLKNSALFCILSVLLFGCKSSSEKGITTVCLTHEEIKLPEMMVGVPGSIQRLGDGLLIMDLKSDSVLHYVDLKEKKYVGKFGAVGQGPDEFIHLRRLHPAQGKAVYGYDMSKLEMKVMTPDSSGIRIEKVRFDSSDRWAFDVIPYGQNRFVANGCFGNSMFAILDSLGNQVDLAGEYPYKDESEKTISAQNRALAYQGILRVTPKGRLAFATSMSKMLFLYDIQEDRLIQRKVIIDSYGEYKPDTSGGEGSYSVVHNGNLPYCYNDLSVTEDRIYALYSGRTYKEYGLAEFECAYIYVYDWEGNQQALYELDIPLLCFCVDEQARCIYGMANHPDPVLVRFPLP